MEDEMEIGSIGNYYGGLNVKIDSEGRCFWSIENWDGQHWEEIPRHLYDDLIKFELERTCLNP